MKKSEALDELLTAVANWFNDQARRPGGEFPYVNRRNLMEAWVEYEQAEKDEEAQS